MHQIAKIASIPLFLLLISCTPSPVPMTDAFFVFRLSPPALIELSEDFQPLTEIPITYPSDCGLFDIFPSPRGEFLAVELSCAHGQTVLFLDTETGSVTQAYTEADSHFLVWGNDGKAVYLKVNTNGAPQILRVSPDGAKEFVPITELTYDLVPQPTGKDFTFTFSRGLGFGSELWLARQDGRIVELLYADKDNYLAFARWSPDGKQIAFIKIPDSQAPFTVGELWIMGADGTNPHKLAQADAGHGYAGNWSLDGTQIAFVMRENVNDIQADQSAEALISNIYVVNVETGDIKQVTHFSQGRAETPRWSPDGKRLFFQSVTNGRMDVQVADLQTDGLKSILAEPACCPGWMRK